MHSAQHEHFPTNSAIHPVHNAQKSANLSKFSTPGLFNASASNTQESNTSVGGSSMSNHTTPNSKNQFDRCSNVSYRSETSDLFKKVGDAKVTPATDLLSKKMASKDGFWECSTCFLLTKNELSACSVCKAPKPGGPILSLQPTVSIAPATQNQLFGVIPSALTSSEFVFGSMSTKTMNQSQQQSTVVSIPTSKPLFSFTSCLGQNQLVKNVDLSNSKSPSLFNSGSKNISFGNLPTFIASTTSTTASLVPPKPADSSFGKLSISPNKDSLFRGLNIPATTATSNSSSTSTTITTTKSLFNFSFGTNQSTPKIGNFFQSNMSTGSPKITVEDREAVDGENDDEDKVQLVEDSKLIFKPVLDVLPSKIEVKTGEENDEILFCERAKLYRWDVDTWRERGVGDIKLLRSSVDNKSVRCVMRREHVLKVCCNHKIGAGMSLKPMSSNVGRSWSWWAVDYTEQTGDDSSKNLDKRETFAVRFKLADHASEFHRIFTEAVQAAEAGAGISQLDHSKCVDMDKNNENVDRDIEIIEKVLNVSLLIIRLEKCLICT